MIGNYTLEMLCKKYGLNSDKLVQKNNNILEYGEYVDIDKTLNYLINELNISAPNIEKCPSILYRNVDAIKTNIEFIKKANISFNNIETCLHVLSANPSELKNTYEYIKNNYGEEVIAKTTSILRVPVNIIKDVEKLNIPFASKDGNLGVAIGVKWGTTNIEEIKKIINSPEFKKYPHLFTSTTLAHAKLEDIQEIIQSPEFKKYPHLFTSQTLVHAKLEDIQKIIQSPEFKEYPHLFTSQTLAHAKIEDIQKMIHSPEFKEYPHLFTSQTLAYAKIEDIQKMIHSPEFKEYPHLFTSQTLAHAKIEDIQKLLSLEYWSDPRFKHLLTSTIVANSKKMNEKLPILIKLAEENSMDNYLNVAFLLHAPSQNYALIEFLKSENQPLIINDKLNPLFSNQPGVLKKKYGIDLKELMKQFPFEENKKGKGGAKK